MVIYVWIYENSAIELKSRPISKGNDIKIKRKVSPFFAFFTRLCSFHCPPFSIFCPFTWFERGVKVSLNQGENKDDRGQISKHHVHKSRHI